MKCSGTMRHQLPATSCHPSFHTRCTFDSPSALAIQLTKHDIANESVHDSSKENQSGWKRTNQFWWSGQGIKSRRAACCSGAPPAVPHYRLRECTFFSAYCPLRRSRAYTQAATTSTSSPASLQDERRLRRPEAGAASGGASPL